MSWMSEIAIMVEEAAALGVALTVGDFRRSGDHLLLDGMPTDEWFAMAYRNAPDRLEDNPCY